MCGKRSRISSELSGVVSLRRSSASCELLKGISGSLNVAQSRLYLDGLWRQQREAVIEHDVVSSRRKIARLNLGGRDFSAVVVRAGRMAIFEIREPIFVKDVAHDVVSSTARSCNMPVH